MRVAWWSAMVLFVVAAAAVRIASEGRTELAASDEALGRGDVLGATVHARTAARAYLPFAPHVALAYSRLRSIARDEEGKGDLGAALFAWRSIRAAAIGSRSPWIAHDRERQSAETAIARLAAPGAAPARDTGSGRHPVLEGDAPPHTGWAMLLLAGGGLWIAAGFRATSRAWSRGMPERLSLAMAAGGLVTLWVALFFG